MTPADWRLTGPEGEWQRHSASLLIGSRDRLFAFLLQMTQENGSNAGWLSDGQLLRWVLLLVRSTAVIGDLNLLNFLLSTNRFIYTGKLVDDVFAGVDCRKRSAESLNFKGIIPHPVQKRL